MQYAAGRRAKDTYKEKVPKAKSTVLLLLCSWNAVRCDLLECGLRLLVVVVLAFLSVHLRRSQLAKSFVVLLRRKHELQMTRAFKATLAVAVADVSAPVVATGDLTKCVQFPAGLRR